MLLFTSLYFMAKSQRQSLADYRWEHRIVILNKPSDKEQSLMKPYSDSVGLVERKLLFFTVKESLLISLNAKEPVKLKKPDFILPTHQFYLIGLDGGVIVRKKQLLTQKELFAIIDQMPMRIREIKGGNE